MYAIIQTGGEQVRVSVGDKICVEKIKGNFQSEIMLDKVLMVAKEDKIVYGRPYVEGASVKAEIIEIGRMPKVLVFGPRPKKAHRKLKGHRQPYMTLKIKEIIT